MNLPRTIALMNKAKKRMPKRRVIKNKIEINFLLVNPWRIMGVFVLNLLKASSYKNLEFQ